MKICFFTENYYKGGLDTFFINLINAWPDAKDDLTLVCNGTHPGLETISKKINRPVKIERYSRLFTSAIAQGQSTLRFGRSFPVRAIFGLARRLLQYPIFFPWYVFTLILFFWRSDFDRLYEGTSMSNPAAYGASKGGLIQFTRWLATTIAPNVRVNAISPGGIFRNQPETFVQHYEAKTPLARLATEDDFRGAIAYLASDLSKYVTGQNLAVDGGWGVW